MLFLRSLMYVGFIGAVVAGWFVSRRDKKRPMQQNVAAVTTFDTPEAMQQGLKNSQWRTRLAAVNALKQEKSSENLETLLGMLDDSAADVREAAADGIVAYADEAIPALHTLLTTGNLTVRETAIQALRTIGTPAIIPVLIQALQQDESAWVRVPAAQGLGDLGGPEAAAALLAALEDPHPDVIKAVQDARRYLEN